MKKLICGFCGAEESDENPIIRGDKCMICSMCVLSAYTLLFSDDSIDNTAEEIDYLETIRKKSAKTSTKKETDE